MWVFTQNMYQKCVKTHIFHLWGKFHKQFLCYYYCLIRIKYAKKSSISTRIAVTVTVWAQKGLEDRCRKCNIFQPIFQPFLLSSHRCHWRHGLSDYVYSPTDCTEFTKLLAENVLPQISQIYTDCLGAFKGVHLSQVHQPSKKCTNLKLAASV